MAIDTRRGKEDDEHEDDSNQEDEEQDRGSMQDAGSEVDDVHSWRNRNKALFRGQDIFLHKSIPDGWRAEVKKEIVGRGGSVVESRSEAKWVLVNNSYGDFANFRKEQLAKQRIVEDVSWVNLCIRRNAVQGTRPVGGRRPNDGREYSKYFTDEDRQHLAEYFAEFHPQKAGRLGNSIHRRVADENDWGEEHTWQGWRQYYKRNQDQIDDMVDEILRKRQSGQPPASHPPHPQRSKTPARTTARAKDHDLAAFARKGRDGIWYDCFGSPLADLDQASRRGRVPPIVSASPRRSPSEESTDRSPSPPPRRHGKDSQRPGKRGRRAVHSESSVEPPSPPVKEKRKGNWPPKRPGGKVKRQTARPGPAEATTSASARNTRKEPTPPPALDPQEDFGFGGPENDDLYINELPDPTLVNPPSQNHDQDDGEKGKQSQVPASVLHGPSAVEAAGSEPSLTQQTAVEPTTSQQPTGNLARVIAVADGPQGRPDSEPFLTQQTAVEPSASQQPTGNLARLIAVAERPQRRRDTEPSLTQQTAVEPSTSEQPTGNLARLIAVAEGPQGKESEPSLTQQTVFQPSTSRQLTGNLARLIAVADGHQGRTESKTVGSTAGAASPLVTRRSTFGFRPARSSNALAISETHATVGSTLSRRSTDAADAAIVENELFGLDKDEIEDDPTADVDEEDDVDVEIDDIDDELGAKLANFQRATADAERLASMTSPERRPFVTGSHHNTPIVNLDHASIAPPILQPPVTVRNLNIATIIEPRRTRKRAAAEMDANENDDPFTEPRRVTRASATPQPTPYRPPPATNAYRLRTRAGSKQPEDRSKNNYEPLANTKAAAVKRTLRTGKS